VPKILTSSTSASIAMKSAKESIDDYDKITQAMIIKIVKANVIDNYENIF